MKIVQLEGHCSLQATAAIEVQRRDAARSLLIKTKAIGELRSQQFSIPFRRICGRIDEVASLSSRSFIKFDYLPTLSTKPPRQVLKGLSNLGYWHWILAYGISRRLITAEVLSYKVLKCKLPQESSA